MWMGRTHPLLTSVRASWMEDGGAEGGDHEDDEQQEDERHPVRDDHKGRIRSVYALPGDYHSYHLKLQDSKKSFMSLKQVVPHLIWVNLG